ncbi:MAG TPA: DUF4191 domain-containing protein [Arachnia sp.]|nr:DUF4191 domain-containing protein [Arachnia sp.]HMT86025.1 DUF4191 domain-containing protein [Arachnia sp.]
MASEKAKALAAKQKAELQAEKLRKKNSTDPADWGRIRQIREAYTATAKVDKPLPWIMAGCFAGPIVALSVLGFFLARSASGINWISMVLWVVLGISAGMLLALLVLTRRVRAAAFVRYDGEPGSGEVALNMLNEKKWTRSPAIAVTKSFDAVHRALGPAGIVLVGDGEAGRLKPLLASERKKHEQVAFGVPVTVIQMGKGTGQVPLNELTKHIEKLPKAIDQSKVNETANRLRALDAMRPKAPIPKGYINTKGARSAMRGR